jgi:hypothetical protein
VIGSVSSGNVRTLKHGTSYQKLAEALEERHDVRVSDTWLWRYLNTGRESA